MVLGPRVLVPVALVLACAMRGNAWAAQRVTRAPQAPLAPFVGVNVNRLFNDATPAADIERQLTAVRMAGITIARTDALWAFMDPWGPPGPGSPGFLRATDRRARLLAEHDLRWQPVLDYTPGWAQSRDGDMHSPPSDPRQFADFAGRFAARYGHGGSFWAANPDLPCRPVEMYEIWNEENDAKFWSPTPDPAGYADLYLLARAAIHRVDPGAVVAIGGLANDGGAFLRRMYTARPGLLGQVDAVAVHPYAKRVNNVLASVDHFRATLLAQRAGAVPLYITELGWYTHAPPGARLLESQHTRADSLARVLHGLITCRTRDNLRLVEPYTWWTPEQDARNDEDWYGLSHTDGKLSPAGKVLATFARTQSSTRSPTRIPGSYARPVRAGQPRGPE